MNGVQTAFPKAGRASLEARARRHAEELSFARGGLGCVSGDTDRLVVNMLRHEYTDYDDAQSADRHRAACLAIAARYPWLAAECQRQIRERAEAERFEASYLADLVEEQARARERRAQTIAASRQAARTFRVGQAVEVTIMGHRRSATVTKVGRSRLTVAYQIKSGAGRTAVVYASEVRALSASS